MKEDIDMMKENDCSIAGAIPCHRHAASERAQEMDLAEFGRAIGHKSRVAMLQALMGGKALSASELSWHADVTNQTATSHLNELVNTGLLYRRKCGRFHYYELSSKEVASIIEQLALAVPVNGRRDPGRSVKPELKKARFCYDHLAGELGVAISRILVDRGALTLEQDNFYLPEEEHAIYREIGIDLTEVRSKRRQLCPRCVDWTEKLPHVAGALGAAIAEKMVERKFIVRSRHDRSVRITKEGSSFLIGRLGLSSPFT